MPQCASGMQTAPLLNGSLARGSRNKHLTLIGVVDRDALSITSTCTVLMLPAMAAVRFVMLEPTSSSLQSSGLQQLWTRLPAGASIHSQLFTVPQCTSAV